MQEIPKSSSEPARSPLWLAAEASAKDIITKRLINQPSVEFLVSTPFTRRPIELLMMESYINGYTAGIDAAKQVIKEAGLTVPPASKEPPSNV